MVVSARPLKGVEVNAKLDGLMKTAVLPEGRLGIAAAAVEGRIAEAASTGWPFVAVLGAILPPSDRLLNVVWVYCVEQGVAGPPS